MADLAATFTLVVTTKNGVTIDYSIAGEYARECRAAAIVESKENPIIIGDSGEAFGLLQIHPTEFKRWFGMLGEVYPLSNSDTWLVAEIKTYATFLTAYRFHAESQEQRDLIIQAWNRGEAAVFQHGERNLQYLSDWLAAYDSIQGIGA